MTKRLTITIETNVKAPIEFVWQTWNNPDHVIHWNHALEDWHSPRANNDLKIGGKFNYRMEAKDGSFGFDFSGTYVEINEPTLVVTRLDDNRLVQTEFIQLEEYVNVIENFEVEDENSVELQRQGWQAILDNFKHYTECLVNKRTTFVD